MNWLVCLLNLLRSLARFALLLLPFYSTLWSAPLLFGWKITFVSSFVFATGTFLLVTLESLELFDYVDSGLLLLTVGDLLVAASRLAFGRFRSFWCALLPVCPVVASSPMFLHFLHFLQDGRCFLLFAFGVVTFVFLFLRVFFPAPFSFIEGLIAARVFAAFCFVCCWLSLKQWWRRHLFACEHSLTRMRLPLYTVEL